MFDKTLTEVGVSRPPDYITGKKIIIINRQQWAKLNKHCSSRLWLWQINETKNYNGKCEKCEWDNGLLFRCLRPHIAHIYHTIWQWLTGDTEKKKKKLSTERVPRPRTASPCNYAVKVNNQFIYLFFCAVRNESPMDDTHSWRPCAKERGDARVRKRAQMA